MNPADFNGPFDNQWIDRCSFVFPLNNMLYSRSSVKRFYGLLLASITWTEVLLTFKSHHEGDKLLDEFL